MSGEKDRLIDPSGQPNAPPPAPAPYPEQPPPYTAPPPSSQGAYPPRYAAPPPPQGFPPHPYGTAGGTGQTVTVVQTQPVVRQVIVDLKPPNYVVFSLLVLIFGCWIFGLIALIFALQVDSAWASGDREGARRNSALARGWSLAGIVFGVIVYVAVVIAVAVVNTV